MTSENSPPPYEFNSLTLVEGHELDNSIVAVNPQTLASLNGVAVGTPVLIQASSEGIRGHIGETVCTISTDQAVQPGRIKVNPCVKYSLGVPWGEHVRIERCANIGFGQSVTVSTTQDSMKFIEEDLQSEFITPYFDVGYRPVHVGDLFLIKSKCGTKALECKITECDPAPYCFVTPNTQVIYADAEPREIGNNMLHEFHEFRVQERERARQANVARSSSETGRSFTFAMTPNQMPSGLRPGELVSVVPGPDGRPRLQRIVPAGEVHGGGQMAYTSTVIVSPNRLDDGVRSARTTYLCVRLCVCSFIVIGCIIGGIIAGFSSS